MDQLAHHYELMMRWNEVVNLTRIERLDEVDASTWRFGLVAGLQIRGAIFETQPTVHALRQVGWRRDDAQTHMPSGRRVCGTCTPGTT